MFPNKVRLKDVENMNSRYQFIIWETDDLTGKIHNRTLAEAMEIIYDYGYTQKKWYQFWRKSGTMILWDNKPGKSTQVIKF